MTPPSLAPPALTAFLLALWSSTESLSTLPTPPSPWPPPADDQQPHLSLLPSVLLPTSSPSSTSFFKTLQTLTTSAISPLDYMVQKTAVPRDRQQPWPGALGYVLTRLTALGCAPGCRPSGADANSAPPTASFRGSIPRQAPKARKNISPGRQPWVSVPKHVSPGGAKDQVQR
jgi:hypothetical protein